MAAKAQTESGDKTRDLAAITGLVEVDTEKAIAGICRDILLTAYRHGSSDVQEAAARVYKQWYGVEPHADRFHIRPYGLFGPPGHGKTTAFREAAKKCATAMGMEYVENTELLSTKITKKHFGFVMQETAGVQSSIEWAGMPAKEDDPDDPNGAKRMARVYSAQLLQLKKCGAGVLVMDDLLNAVPAIQNVALALTEEKRFGTLDMSSITMGITGNLGALDGTHTMRISTALRGRVKPFMVRDTPKNWIARTQRDFNDDLSDVGIVGFMTCHENDFSELPDPRHSGGFACPRNWTALGVELRNIIASAGGRANMASALTDISLACRSIVGPTKGLIAATYYHSLAQSAEPLARAVIMDDVFDEKEIGKRYNSGFSSNQTHFGYQYASSLSDWAVQKVITDGGKINTAITRFLNGILPIPGTQVFSLALEMLTSKLAARVDSLAEKHRNGRISLTEKKKREINDIYLAMKHPLRTAEHDELMINTLSEINKVSGNGPRRARAG